MELAYSGRSILIREYISKEVQYAKKIYIAPKSTNKSAPEPVWGSLLVDSYASYYMTTPRVF